jgi:uncharacterized membrane protein YjjB (DUF3815 family)
VALAVAPLTFTVLLRAQPRDAGWILVVGVLGVLGGRMGARALGPELGVFLGALTVGIASNLYTRLLRRPATVTMVPGLLLLVPGSVGFQSLVALLGRDVLPGIQTAFTMVLMAIALVAGLLAANIVAPAPRGAAAA